jgi:hypothetical protein
MALVTVIGPVVAVDETLALSWVEETRFALAALTPLNLTTELLLKPTPLSVTTVPVGPLGGLKLVIESVGVKFVALDPVPAGVVTEIFPGTAPFGTTALSCTLETNVTDGEASAPNLTVAPGTKFVPLIVTELPVIPAAGLKEPTVGAA